jgi:hypothetical protein
MKLPDSDIVDATDIETELQLNLWIALIAGQMKRNLSVGYHWREYWW